MSSQENRMRAAGRAPSAANGNHTATAPLRLAILGGGAVVTEYYLPAVQLCSRVQMVAIADPNAVAQSRLRDAGYAGPVLKATHKDVWPHFAALTGGPPEAVIIALPNDLHEEAALAALSAGYHVLCEKPLALTEAACRRIAEAGQNAQRVAAVGMVRRLLPSVTALREALAARLAGQTQSVDVEDGCYYPWLSDSGAFFRRENGGILADMGVHYLDLVADLFGALEPVSYRDDWQGGCEANAEYCLRTATGVSVRLRVSRDRKLLNRLLVQGTEGCLKLEKDDFTACYWEPASAPGLVGKLEPAAPFFDKTWPREFVSAFAQQFEEFAEAVRGKRPSRCDALEAAGVIRLIEHAYSAGRAEQSSHGFGHLKTDDGGPRLPTGPVVVTGASGFIGSRLVARLASQACGPIIAPVRGYRSCVELARFRVEMPRLDLLDAAAVRQAVEGTRHVFHLAYGRDGDDGYRVTVDGTRNVVEAAIGAGCESIVVLSTMFVFGQPVERRPVDESFPYAPIGGDYGRSKAAMERWCLERAKSSPRTRIVVLNPTCVYGVQGKTFTRMPAELAARGQFCWIEDGRGIANHVYVENLVDAMLLAATSESARGQRFIVNDGCTTWRGFLTPLLGEYSAGLPSYTRPELEELSRSPPKRLRDLVRAVARSPEISATVNEMRWLGPLKQALLSRLPRWRTQLRQLSRQRSASLPAPAVPPLWLEELFSPAQTHFSAERAAEVLHWRPRVDFPTAMRATTQWLEAIGVLGTQAS